MKFTRIISLITITGVVVLLGADFFLEQKSSKSPSQIQTQKQSSLNTQHREPFSICEDIYSVICSNQVLMDDPTGTVRSEIEGEQLAARTYENLKQLHPDWNRNQIHREFVRQVYTPKVRKQLESNFRWVRMTLIKMIDSQSQKIFTREEKKQLKQRLTKTQLDLPSGDSPYADEPDLLIKSEVFYELLGNHEIRLRIGGAYPLSVKSRFNIIFTLAHELAHAIDPCEIRSAHLSYPAYDRLTACFLNHGIIATRQNRSECGRHDQLSETFADWFAVEILAKALGQFATEFKNEALLAAVINSVKDLCQINNGIPEENNDLHPSAQIRLNQIFGKNPKIREILGCTAIPENTGDGFPAYCSF